MDKKLTKEIEEILSELDDPEIDELIQYIRDMKDEREAHELQHEAESQEYYASQVEEAENENIRSE
ncbi:hypothetical protein LCGC14_2507820 [marine sediment metagenome]|uniref:Uncharacterized protein n=1 Tax=marine sediment metagenome TaxID=412755 RepID=A0A0F9DBW5_9ZZZZ